MRWQIHVSDLKQKDTKSNCKRDDIHTEGAIFELLIMTGVNKDEL